MTGSRRWLLVAGALVVFCLVRVIATYRVFSQTVDEPVHVAAGFQWLTTSRYDLDAEHPPLARVLFALTAARDHATVNRDAERTAQGNELLYRNDRYKHNLATARAGNLPFLLLALGAVFVWTRRLFDDATAVVALAIFSSIPAVLGHAGLATTDMAATATVVAAAAALDAMLDENRRGRLSPIGLGLLIGIGALSKLSFLVYFPIAAVCLMLARRRLPLRQLLVALPVALLTIWAGYKFDVGTLNAARLVALPDGSTARNVAKYNGYPGYGWLRPDLMERYYAYCRDAEAKGKTGIDIADWAKAAGYPSPAAGRHGNTLAGAPPLPPPTFSQRLLERPRAALHTVARDMPIPAPLFVAGLEFVSQHSHNGHPSFLLGQRTEGGWWYYFPVVFFFKTPLAFTLLALAGMGLLARVPHARGLALAPLAMLVPPITSAINIGIRHILPIYPFLAIAAAVAAMTLWRRSRVAAALLLVWLFAASLLAHPDYLPYFNETARHPEQIASDSNLDWGQDLFRLADVVRREHLQPIHVAYFGSADRLRHLPGSIDLGPGPCVTGWVAVSETHLAIGGPHHRGDGFEWLAAIRRYRRIGKSIRLMHVERCN